MSSDWWHWTKRRWWTRQRSALGSVLAAALVATMLAVTLVTSMAGCASDTGVVAGVARPVAQAAAQPEPTTSAAAPDTAVLAFAGDVHFAERTTSLLEDPASAFGPVSQLLQTADLAVLNLETAVTTRGEAEPKKFLFRAPPTAYQAVRAAGVDAVSVGNNHVLDYGRVGLADSIEHARAAGVPAFGAGPGADAAWAPWLTEVNGTRIAFVGISQVHELEASWVATTSRAGVAHARNAERSVQAVRAASQQADFVAVYMHWGKEGSQCPTAEMRSFAKLLADAGADLIVGTHAHLLLGDGWLGDTFVAYGLGNFLWWWNDAHSNDTGVLRVTLRAGKIVHTELVPAYISRTTGQPLPVSGAEAERINAKYASLRGCTGLAAAPGG